MATSNRGTIMSPGAERRMALIIWCVFVGLVLVLAAFATIVGPRVRPRMDAGTGRIFAWVGLMFAAAGPLASRVLQERTTPPAGATIDSLTRGHAFVAISLSGSTGLVATVAWMVGGDAVAAAAIVTALLALLLVFPSARRWQELRGRIARSGVLARAAPADDWAARFPIRAKIFVAGNMAFLVLALVALALLGIRLWNEAIVGRPASPVVPRLPIATLAVAIAWIGTSKLLTAPGSRRPRRGRAYGVLLLLFAGYMLLLAASGA